MSPNISLLLASYGIHILNGSRRAQAQLLNGMTIQMRDSSGDTFQVTFVNNELVYEPTTGDPRIATLVERRHIEPHAVTFKDGRKLHVRPVPMSFIPSSHPARWDAFLTDPDPALTLNDLEQQRLRNYMRQHDTEAVTEGSVFLTLSGDTVFHRRPELSVDDSGKLILPPGERNTLVAKAAQLGVDIEKLTSIVEKLDSHPARERLSVRRQLANLDLERAKTEKAKLDQTLTISVDTQ